MTEIFYGMLAALLTVGLLSGDAEKLARRAYDKAGADIQASKNQARIAQALEKMAEGCGK